MVELHQTLLEAIVRLPLLQPATLDVLMEGHRLVVELHPTVLEALAPFFCPMLMSHLVTSIRQLGLDADYEKQGLKTPTKLQVRKIFPFWLKRGDIMLGDLKKSLLNLDRSTIRSVAEAISLRY